MKITLNIPDKKAPFFMELIRSMDFISVEDRELQELTSAQKKELDRRINLYHNHPEQLLDWDDVKKEIEDLL